MKMLIAIGLLLCSAGVTNAVAAGDACDQSNKCDADLTCQTTCKKNIGQPCTSGSKECVAGAECGDVSGTDKCKCPANTSPNTASNKCLKYVDQTCEVQGDCVAHTQCKDKKCTCATDYLPLYDKSRCGKAPKQQCANNKDCGEHAECTVSAPKVCQCKTGFDFKDGQRCGKKVGQVCTEDKQCVTGANCQGAVGSKKCTCKDNYDNDGNDFCDSATSATVSLALIMAALVVSRWM